MTSAPQRRLPRPPQSRPQPHARRARPGSRSFFSPSCLGRRLLYCTDCPRLSPLVRAPTPGTQILRALRPCLPSICASVHRVSRHVALARGRMLGRGPRDVGVETPSGRAVRERPVSASARGWSTKSRAIADMAALTPSICTIITALANCASRSSPTATAITLRPLQHGFQREIRRRDRSRHHEHAVLDIRSHRKPRGFPPS